MFITNATEVLDKTKEWCAKSFSDDRYTVSIKDTEAFKFLMSPEEGLRVEVTPLYPKAKKIKYDEYLHVPNENERDTFVDTIIDNISLHLVSFPYPYSVHRFLGSLHIRVELPNEDST